MCNPVYLSSTGDQYVIPVQQTLLIIPFLRIIINLVNKKGHQDTKGGIIWFEINNSNSIMLSGSTVIFQNLGISGDLAGLPVVSDLSNLEIVPKNRLRAERAAECYKIIHEFAAANNLYDNLQQVNLHSIVTRFTRYKTLMIDFPQL